MSAVPNRPIIQKGQKTRRKVLDFSAFALPKDVQYINQAIRDAARGEPCMLNVDGVCCYDTESTVWCHSNLGRHGKGKSRKAHDVFGAFGCRACHHWLDFGSATAGEKEATFMKAFERTLLHCFRTGIYGVEK